MDIEKNILAYLENIKKSNINAFISCDEDYVMAQVSAVKKGIEEKRFTSKIVGMPIAIKDNICTKGLKTTCASKMLKDYVPSYSATVIERLIKAGAIIIGKTNMDEFAMGSTTENSIFGATKNPHNNEYVSGGSSGGSCAAVAANLAVAALGSDTGGSIRQPAGYCGVVGIKPTYGTVSRYGLIAYASSLEQVGPIATNVTDCVNVLEVISGRDKKDSTTVNRSNLAFSKALTLGIKGFKIGVPRQYIEDADEEVKNAILETAKNFEKLGAVVEYFDLHATDYAVAAYYIIACAEASSNLSRFDGVRYGYRTDKYDSLDEMYKKTRSEGFLDETKRRILLGTFVLSEGYYDAYYMKAMKAKAVIKEEFDRVFKQYDLILAPTSPIKASKIGELIKDSVKMYLSDVCTVATNLAGLPAIAMPCAKDSNNVPIGMQLIADRFNEHKMIQAAYTFEKERAIYE
ncbi:MAG: Asp-tRNA(Asn)/Glu-tRNA(Gln) amidotransferase subunit GatA [Lachnospira sp.]|nr:Asp-tRNA(Asn)/Glu-tRNA(Gln) amidotransferase subunit GatA [Lachnospira sp.]